MSEALVAKATSYLLDPANKPLLSLIKGVRNGIVYGTKVRFPHALVMTFLFRTGTLEEKLRSVFDATKTHARNLATFVLLFKCISVLLTAKAGAEPGLLTAQTTIKKQPGIDTFIAGAIAGYLVFGRDGNNGVNQQIVLYVFGRTMMGLLKLAGQETGLAKLDGDGKDGKGMWWGMFAAASWGGVMFMYKNYPHLLQNSLTSSMVYLYEDSEVWDGWRNFLWHNK